MNAGPEFLQRFGTIEPTICAVCRRRATWLGYAPLGRFMSQQGRILWLCDDHGCHQAGKHVYTMSKIVLDQYEKMAMRRAGAEAGRFLEEIGAAEGLAKLTDEQWVEFLTQLITGFECHLRQLILDSPPPF